MKHPGRASVLAGVALALSSPMAFAQPSAAEFKCEAAVSKARAKFIAAKAKCVDQCFTAFWKGERPEVHCLPPFYGGASSLTATCLFDPQKGAEAKFAAAIKKACDPATKPSADCPECYDGGDCGDSGVATSRVQATAAQTETFVVGVMCERASAALDERDCQLGTAKAVVKQIGSVGKCYDKCKADEFKGKLSPGACDPPASDPATQTCVGKAVDKAIASIDKICEPPATASAKPDCPGPDQYPTGTFWAMVATAVIEQDLPTTYCE